MVLFWTLLPWASAIVVLVGCAAVRWFLRRRQTFWVRRGIPAAAEKPHLLYGNVKGITSERHTATILLQLYRGFRQRRLLAGGFNLLFSPVLLVIDPILIERVLVRDFEQFQDRGLYANAQGNPLFCETLFTLGGERWRDLRRQLGPALATVNVRTLFEATVRIAQSLTNYVAGQERPQEIEWADLLARYTTDVIGSCAFGIDCRTIRDRHRDEFRTMGHRAFQFSLRRMWKLRFGYTFRRLADVLRLCVQESSVERFFLQLCHSTVLYRESYQTVKRDFLQILLEMKGRGQLDMTQVAAQCYQFFIAGFETSASLLNFCLYELARNVDVQRRLRLAISRALDETDGQLSYDVVTSLDYLDQVVKETLRMYPPVDFLFRVSSVDYEIDGVGTIPRDTLFVVPVYAIHHDPEYYPQPEVYDPDRFAEQPADAQPLTFLPFGHGPRQCLGEHFGLMLVKVGLVSLLRTFRFSLDTDRMPASINFKPRSLVLAPASGVYLNVERV